MEIVTSPPKKRKPPGDSPTAHKTIEKRRRDRINESLNVLRTLVPAARKTQGVKNDKVELLKMTIEYLREQQQGKVYDPNLVGSSSHGGHVSSPPPNEDIHRQMRQGVEDCIQDVAKFLMETEGMRPTDPQLVNLLTHLKCWAVTSSQPFPDRHSAHRSHHTVPLAHETHTTALQTGSQAGMVELQRSTRGTAASNALGHSSVSRGLTSVPILTSPTTTQVSTTRATALMPVTGQLTNPSSSQPNGHKKVSSSGGLIKSEYSSGLDLISTVSMATVSMAAKQQPDHVSSEASVPVQTAVTQRPVSVLLQQPPSASPAFPVQPTQAVAVVPAATHPLVAPPPLAVPNQSTPVTQPNAVQASPAARLPTAATVYIHPASVLAAGTTQLSAGTAAGWPPSGSVIGQVAPTATIAGPNNIAAPQVIASQPMHMTALPLPPTGGYLSFWPSQPTAYITAPAVASTTSSSQQQWQQ